MRHAVEHGAAVVMHQGLGQAGGAAGINNPQRVVERHPQGFKGLRSCVIALHDLAPVAAVVWHGYAAQVAVNHHMRHAGQGGA